MARTVRDTNLETRTARLRLVVRSEPYWRSVEHGLALGYRRNKSAGTWLVRRLIAGGKYIECSLGVPDDFTDADGVSVLSYRQAQERARAWWVQEQRRDAGLEPGHKGVYTIQHALEDYFAARQRKSSKSVAADRYQARARIEPELGALDTAKLTAARLRRWHEELAVKPKMVRTKRRAKQQAVHEVDVADVDAMRARRSTANRVLTILKAALNYAFHEGRISVDEAWRKVKPFRAVDMPIVRFLSPSECVRLVNACASDFRKLAYAALLTGCRYGELTRLCVADVNFAAGTLTVRESKSGKARHVVLTDEAQALFADLVAGKENAALVFIRDDGNPWGASHQQRPLEEASRRAGLVPAVTFHILRHTHASTLAMRGVPMGVIAAQLGHADTRMTERHYAHLSPNYVADTIRAHFPKLGIETGGKVVALSGGR